MDMCQRSRKCGFHLRLLEIGNRCREQLKGYIVHTYNVCDVYNHKDKARKKHTLQQFPASLFLEIGIKLSEQEAVGTFIDFSSALKEEFVRQIKKIPLERNTAWKMPSKPVNWGVREAAENVYMNLYGFERRGE